MAWGKLWMKEGSWSLQGMGGKLLGPYDAIHVGAAAPTTPPKLVEQLASPGRMFIPVGTYMQQIVHVDKDSNGKVAHKQVMGVS
ncbi:hypothetical protein H0H87_007005 [Tephrocybe sp. NHM501043]|nr:hypothetical protein H0H87_007005 [Tephrocybe sp. NHM501043]